MNRAVFTIFRQAEGGGFFLPGAQNRQKSDISEALGPLHYITLEAFVMASEDGTKCKIGRPLGF